MTPRERGPANFSVVLCGAKPECGWMGAHSDNNGSGADEFESWLQEAAKLESATHTSLPNAGQVISNRYRIGALLGKGAMGVVFQATDMVSDESLALKWMLRSATDEPAMQRFAREAQAAGRIDHPNVVRVHEIGRDGDAAYLVMELLHGQSLRQRMASGPLAVSATIDLLLPAMRGVAAAHAEGVIHRDLKPDNIFLCSEPHGTGIQAKVLDFGISTIKAHDVTSTTLTKDGMLLGTPAYMSAEQLSDPKAADARADVHALGVILFECLTGRLPFEAANPTALILAITGGDPAPARRYRPDLPERLEAVLMRAVKQPRYGSVEELIEALLPFASNSMGSSITGSDENANDSQRPTSKRQPRVAFIAGAAFALLLLLLALAQVRGAGFSIMH